MQNNNSNNNFITMYEIIIKYRVWNNNKESRQKYSAKNSTHSYIEITVLILFIILDLH